MHRQLPKQCMWLTTAIAIVLVSSFAAAPASASGLTGLGGNVGYANPENLDGTAAVAVQAELQQPGTRVHLDPNMRMWNVNGVRDVTPNMDLTYHFGRETHAVRYL